MVTPREYVDMIRDFRSVLGTHTKEFMTQLHTGEQSVHLTCYSEDAAKTLQTEIASRGFRSTVRDDSDTRESVYTVIVRFY